MKWENKRNLLIIFALCIVIIFVTTLLNNKTANNIKEDNYGIIYIGSNRTKDMFNITNKKNEFFIGKSEYGTSIFLQSSIQQVNTIINNNQYKKWKIVICFDLSDFNDINNSLIEQVNNIIINEFKNYNVYIAPINPVDSIKMEKNEYKEIQNSEIEIINNMIKNNIKNVKYIDTYNYILESSITTDGVYYNEDTYKDIHDYIIRFIEFDKI